MRKLLERCMVSNAQKFFGDFLGTTTWNIKKNSLSKMQGKGILGPIPKILRFLGGRGEISCFLDPPPSQDQETALLSIKNGFSGILGSFGKWIIQF
jgi:hypothetical protein